MYYICVHNIYVYELLLYSCIFVPAAYCSLVFIELVFYDGHKNIIISIVHTIDNRGEVSDDDDLRKA